MNITKSETRLIPSIVVVLLLASCGGGGGSVPSKFEPNTPEACFAGSGKAEVLNIMQDWYLWNDEADQFNKYRNIDLDNFSDADGLLNFLRYRPAEFDRGFSYITTPEEEEAFFGEGQFIGFGFGMVQIGDEIRFSQIYPGSPAESAGFQRGFGLLAINGRSIAEIAAAEGLSAALGPAEAGFSLTFTVENAAGVELPPAELSKALVTIDPVPFVTTLQDGGGNDVGYVLFNTFITSASDELRAAFAQFEAGSLSRVVIDLRYNGGGLVSVSEVLASLLAGDGNIGQIYSVTTFNSARAADFNETSLFHAEANALTLDKIVFITSGGSASASELVINGLTPYFTGPGQLALVGSTSFGKPVGQFGFDFCDEEFRLRAVTFKSVNAQGEGDYFDGLPVDCPAGDDVFNQLGDPAEASLAAALEYMETGSCPAASAPRFGLNRLKAEVRPVTGPGLARHYAGAF